MQLLYAINIEKSIVFKKNLYFGTETCACLDTSALALLEQTSTRNQLNKLNQKAKMPVSVSHFRFLLFFFFSFLLW